MSLMGPMSLMRLISFMGLMGPIRLISPMIPINRNLD